MSTMPAAEASEAVTFEIERNCYELAFHILPTVAEGEVQGVFDAIKTLITKDQGEIFDEESPERFELAYEIIKQYEGKNRKFTSAYFGWVRFKAEAEIVHKLLEEVEGKPEILRHILIKLSKTEEENPFRFHEAIESFKMVTTIDEAELVADEEVVVTNEATAEVTEEKVVV
jgi:ribosomal protein S6